MALPPINAIETERLLVTPAEAGHLDELLEVNGDDQVTRFLPYETWTGRGDAEAWLAGMNLLSQSGMCRQLVLLQKADSRAVGTLLLFNFEEKCRRVEIGYALGRVWWGRGLMNEAVRDVCDYAFSAMNIRRIEAEVNIANTASCDLLTRVGFQLEGRLRQRWTVKGITYDTNMYGLLVDDWGLGKM
jgi:ribosomal-protein-alanine N-acetyltransferase